MLKYLLRYHGIENPETLKKISEKLVQEEHMPDVVDILIAEGLQKGRQEGQRESVIKLLSKGVLTPEQIASALELDLSRVLEIQAEIDRKPAS